MREYRPVGVRWFPFGVALGGLLAVALSPLFALWAVAPALAGGVLAGHLIESYFGGVDLDWGNAALGAAIGASGGALAVLVISAIPG